MSKGHIVGIGTLIGYFTKQDEARKALQALAQQGFSRTALIHKGTNGAIHIDRRPFWRGGVEPEVIRNYASWLVPGETVLILQAPVESLPRPVE